MHYEDKIFPNSLHCGLIGTAWKDFAYGIRVLHRLVLVLRSKDLPFDGRLSFLAIVKYNRQVLKKLDDKLRPAKDVSVANGFVRETIESNISDFWNSLFDDEEATPEALNIRICDLFQPIFGESWHRYAANPSGQPIFGESCHRYAANPSGQPILGHSEIPTLPVLGLNFAKQELREEVVRLGVELSLYVAQSMFLLCDDIRRMLLFCYKLWTDSKKDLKQPDSPVMERLLRVIHYVYSEYIKPKNGVYQIGGQSVQWSLAKTTWENFHAGIRDLDLLVSIRGREGRYLDGREFTASIEEALMKVEEKLRCAKGVSEANGFARDAVESNILDIWKSLFDKETEDAWALKMMRVGILTDLFYPLSKEEEVAAKQD